MGRFFEHIVLFFNKHLWAYCLTLAALLTVGYFGFTRLQLDNDIYSIFPEGKEYQQFKSILKDNKLNQQVVFSIATNEQDIDALYESLDKVGNAIQKQCAGYIENLQLERSDDEQLALNHYYDFLPLFLNKSDYQKIQKKLVDDSLQTSIGGVRTQLESMNGLFIQRFLARDPLGLMWPKVSAMIPQIKNPRMEVEEGLIFTKDRKRIIFTGNLTFEQSASDSLYQLVNQLENITEEYQSADFDYFGPFLVAYENSKQVKKDTSWTMLIGVGLILLILLVYYRSILVPFYFILPALFSGFMGIGILGYIQPSVPAISIATAAVLLGIVLDYTFHFITHYAHDGNLTRTVRELSFPMLVGSFTTIAAFFALLFANSVVIQNFGLLALLTLSSAALFTLLLLPTLLHITRFKLKPRKESSNFLKAPKILVRLSVLGTVILAVVFLFANWQVQFDGDINNLSYHPNELIQKEDFYTGINPKTEKKLHFFVTGKNLDEASEKNQELSNALTEFSRDKGIEEVVSVAPYVFSNKQIQVKSEEWNSFWHQNEMVFDSIQQLASEVGFQPTAFDPFKNWALKKQEITQENGLEVAEALGFTNLINEGHNKVTIASSIVVNRSSLADLKDHIQANTDAFIFDVSDMASQLILTVQDDFNFLLAISAIIVFLSLLVIYGRIELALFSLFPMVVSWILILTISHFFGLYFNFVNVLVATFIFGLGDDFSIFVTDGLIQKYKTNSNVLSSFKVAILLSGITTIIGTGVLFFAKHPAVHSIAAISVIGIGCILFVTLVVQPSIFAFFITKRTDKKKSPVTLLGLLYSAILFSYFFVGSMLLNVFLLVMYPFPASKKKKQSILNYLISKLTRSTIYFGLHVKKKYIDFDKIDFSKPSIIVANHSSFLDILVMLMIHPKNIIMVKSWVYNSPVFGPFIRYAGYLFVEDGTTTNLETFKERIADGYSIVVFPEGTRSKDGEIKRFHKGAFFLAQELQLPIQPILIHGVNYINPKNDFIIKSGTIALKALDPILPESPLHQKRLGLLANTVADQLREAKKSTDNEICDGTYLKSRLMYNYLYKSPVIEWYVRIKWEFEKKNFEVYDRLIGERQSIMDIGCGYGYLSFFLHYRDGERKIQGVDYDEDKIALAQNSYDKTENLHFESGDIRLLNYEGKDVVFINDVLHYLKEEEQLPLLERIVAEMNPGGMILLRDGISNLNDRHKTTQKTEKYSTQLFGFNKTSNELHFFSSSDIFEFAKTNGLTCEMQEQSEKTSNVLFILTKAT